MKTLAKISRRFDAITQENVWSGKQILDFQNFDSGLWKGSKRYAH